MLTKIDFIEDNYLTSYHIKYNKKKLRILKKKLKKLATENIMELNCHMEVLGDILKSSGYDFYEVLKTLSSKKEEEEIFIDEEIDRKYGSRTHQPLQAKMISYPIIYHILFGKYKENNENFMEALSIYLANDYGLRNENNKVLFENQKNQQYRNREPLSVEYDGHLTQEEKYQIVQEFLNSIDFFLVTKENLNFLEEQIKLMTTNSSQKEKLQPLKIRIERAKENTKNLGKIYQLIDPQEKLVPNRRVKKPC